MTKLKLIATPIGNVSDMSIRAKRSLEQADVILAEDTRNFLKLAQHIGLTLKEECRLISCDAHKEKDRAHVVIERLKTHHQVVLISDAGCPVISDPGSLLVQAVIEAGLEVEVVPGASAQTAALMGAGLDTTRFAFLGFLPQKSGARKKIVISAAEAELALVMYEAPQRINQLLAELFEWLGPRRVVVARELTKLFETFHRGKLGEVLNPPFVEKGECVVVVEAGALEMPDVVKQEETIAQFIQAQKNAGLSSKDIAKALSEKFNVKKSAAYDLVIRS